MPHNHDHVHDHDQDTSHGHGHAHGPGGHSHAPDTFGTAFAVGIGLNTVFVCVELAFGFWANSIALIADAGHNLSDVFGLIVAWVGASLAKRAPTKRFSYGLKGSSILAALANAIILLIAIGAIILEAIRRFQDPQPVQGGIVIIVASIGIVINGVTAFLFARGRKGDINIRGAYLHMMADAGVSAAVVGSGILILYTGALWIDPAMSLAVALLILLGTWGLLRDSVVMSLGAVPAHIDVDAVEDHLQKLPGVSAVHDLHVWNMSTSEVALTAHLVLPGGFPGDGFLHETAKAVEEKFGIHHATFQVETSADASCRLEPAHVV